MSDDIGCVVLTLRERDAAVLTLPDGSTVEVVINTAGSSRASVSIVAPKSIRISRRPRPAPVP